MMNIDLQAYHDEVEIIITGKYENYDRFEYDVSNSEMNLYHTITQRTGFPVSASTDSLIDTFGSTLVELVYNAFLYRPGGKLDDTKKNRVSVDLRVYSRQSGDALFKLIITQPFSSEGWTTLKKYQGLTISEMKDTHLKRKKKLIHNDKGTGMRLFSELSEIAPTRLVYRKSRKRPRQITTELTVIIPDSKPREEGSSPISGAENVVGIHLNAVNSKQAQLDQSSPPAEDKGVDGETAAKVRELDSRDQVTLLGYTIGGQQQVLSYGDDGGVFQFVIEGDRVVQIPHKEALLAKAIIHSHQRWEGKTIKVGIWKIHYVLDGDQLVFWSVDLDGNISTHTVRDNTVTSEEVSPASSPVVTASNPVTLEPGPKWSMPDKHDPNNFYYAVKSNGPERLLYPERHGQRRHYSFSVISHYDVHLFNKEYMSNSGFFLIIEFPDSYVHSQLRQMAADIIHSSLGIDDFIQEHLSKHPNNVLYSKVRRDPESALLTPQQMMEEAKHRSDELTRITEGIVENGPGLQVKKLGLVIDRNGDWWQDISPHNHKFHDAVTLGLPIILFPESGADLASAKAKLMNLFPAYRETSPNHFEFTDALGRNDLASSLVEDQKASSHITSKGHYNLLAKTYLRTDFRTVSFFRDPIAFFRFLNALFDPKVIWDLINNPFMKERIGDGVLFFERAGRTALYGGLSKPPFTENEVVMHLDPMNTTQYSTLKRDLKQGDIFEVLRQKGIKKIYAPVHSEKVRRILFTLAKNIGIEIKEELRGPTATTDDVSQISLSNNTHEAYLAISRTNFPRQSGNPLNERFASILYSMEIDDLIDATTASSPVEDKDVDEETAAKVRELDSRDQVTLLGYTIGGQQQVLSYGDDGGVFQFVIEGDRVVQIPHKEALLAKAIIHSHQRWEGKTIKVGIWKIHYVLDGDQLVFWSVDVDRNISKHTVRGNTVTSEKVPSASSPVPGGIDFNPNNLDLQEQGRALDFTIDNSMFQNLQPNSVYGIQPVIINITPIVNFPLLLGESEEQSDAPKNAHYTPKRDPANHKEEDYLKISSLN